MQVFLTELAAATGDAAATGRRRVMRPYDQLTARIGPLSEARPSELALLLVEAPSKASRRPYHKQKLFLVLANQRRFALEQAKRGVHVRYEVAREGEGYAEVLRRVAAEVDGPIAHMEPAERELRAELDPLVVDGLLEALPHEDGSPRPRTSRRGRAPRLPAHGPLLPAGAQADRDPHGRGRQVRGRQGQLRRGEPFALAGDPPAFAVPRFRHGAIEAEVAELIEARYGHHPGDLDPAAIPTRDTHAKKIWEWAKEHCLTLFGPYEDAMAREEANFFHTRVSPLLHLQRLLARDVVEDVATMDAPTASREGFVRQILGWREFVRHVHRATDGMRRLPDGTDMEAEAADDAGWEAWTGEPWEGAPLEPGASPSALGSARPLPPAYWGRTSGLACLDACAGRVVRDGYGHRAPDVLRTRHPARRVAAAADRLVLVRVHRRLRLGGRAQRPRHGDLRHRRRDDDQALRLGGVHRPDVRLLGPCAFHPKKTCPITRLYWAFLARHGDALEGNQRIAMPLRSLAKRAEEKRAEDARIFDAVSRALEAGEEPRPRGWPPRSRTEEPSGLACPGHPRAPRAKSGAWKDTHVLGATGGIGSAPPAAGRAGRARRAGGAGRGAPAALSGSWTLPSPTPPSRTR